MADAEERRRAELREVARSTLESLAAPGDFLCASRRAAVAREALAVVARCPACLKFREQGPCGKGPELFERVEELCRAHAVVDGSGGLGGVVRALANLQNYLDEEWYWRAGRHVLETLQAAGELPAAPEGLPTMGKRDLQVYLVEVIAVVASAVGVRSLHTILGWPLPPLPAPPTPGAPKLASVYELSAAGLEPTGFSWGPMVTKANAKVDCLRRLGVDVDSYLGHTFPVHPFTKVSPVPCSSEVFANWMGKTYVPDDYFARFFARVPGRALSRADIEQVATAYTNGVECAF